MKIPKQAPLFGASNQTKITELFYDTGKLHYRFSQKSTNGTDWINEGAFEEYYQNGSLAKKGFFLNGKKNGHWKEYYENGNLASEGYYLIGAQNGHWKNYYENGNLAADGYYNIGKKHRIWKYYDEGGKLSEENFCD